MYVVLTSYSIIIMHEVAYVHASDVIVGKHEALMIHAKSISPDKVYATLHKRVNSAVTKFVSNIISVHARVDFVPTEIPQMMSKLSSIVGPQIA